LYFILLKIELKAFIINFALYMAIGRKDKEALAFELFMHTDKTQKEISRNSTGGRAYYSQVEGEGQMG